MAAPDGLAKEDAIINKRYYEKEKRSEDVADPIVFSGIYSLEDE